MLSVGASELEEKVGDLLRDVRERGETVEVTDGGEVVARLVPAKSKEQRAREVERTLKELDELTARVSAVWPEGVSAEDVMREDVRREL